MTLPNRVTVGQRFGAWSAQRPVFGPRGGTMHWWCICDCGIQRKVQTSMLIRGKSSGCGCTGLLRTARANSTHSMSNTRTWRIWRAMRRRCYEEDCDSYRNYGGRGITVSERWLKFENFLADMGECPLGLSIERIDVEGHYAPGNCRWASVVEQARNRRTNLMVTIEGVTKPLIAWAEELGIVGYGTVKSRISDLGWSAERALNTPTRILRKSQ